MAEPTVFKGRLLKMDHEADHPIRYFLNLDDTPYEITSRVGSNLTLRFKGVITCVACGRKIKKTYDEGYCFPCARDLPENDICSVRPERCEHEKGDEKAREFWRTHCNVDHFVYLSLTSGVKVGVTRHWNIPSRWIDQGAVEGLIIAKTPERRLAGEIEIALAGHMADKTNWRKMLKGETEPADLMKWREQARDWVPAPLQQYLTGKEKIMKLEYPVASVPAKITSHNLDKEAVLQGVLTGIKGQYLIFDSRVINLRKYAGYHVEFEFN